MQTPALSLTGAMPCDKGNGREREPRGTIGESGMSEEHHDEEPKTDEQEQLAREIGEELTDAFIAFVKGDVAFDVLTFGVYDALSDLHVIAGGEYELEDPDHDDVDDYDEGEAVDEQEELSGEPARS